MTKCIYLSGPMTGLPGLNRQAFNLAAEALRSTGKTVINPAEMNKDDGRSWKDCMRLCLRALPDADVIALLPGWERSDGAHLELYVAHRIGIQVMSIAEVFALEIGQLPVDLRG